MLSAIGSSVHKAAWVRPRLGTSHPAMITSTLQCWASPTERPASLIHLLFLGRLHAGIMRKAELSGVGVGVRVASL